ncbi:12745_t:CDS:2 [Funneliformis geosporum]|uniref:12745_t:CDS:1 n=1 Tax=Funneliformis geosporum TaxID=1117311 RepID=A0A9W4T3B8_9GLOM|nr:12745_t:CDS:2 [Funneliformis geosporum]
MSKQIILAILRGSKDYNNDPQYGEGKVESIKEEVKELGIEVDLIEEHLSEEKAQSFYIRVSTQNNNQREPETSTGNSNGNYNFFTLENINDPKKQKAEMEKDIINQNWEEGVRKLIKGQGNGDDVGFNAVEEEIFLDFDETFFSKACLVPRIKSIYENLETLIKESFSIPLSRDDKDFIITKIETKFKIELMEKQKNKVKSLAKYLTRLAIEELLTENPLEQNVNQTRQNSAAEAKALKLKEILSKYKVELDLNRIKEIVCEAWQVFHAENIKNLADKNLSEEKRREALEELERKEGKNSYQNKKTEFQNSKKELFNQNPSEYKKTMAKVFKKKLIINELDETPELVNLVNEWESSNFDNYEKSEVLENKVKQKIGQTAASNKINKIESRIEKAIKSGNKSEMLSVLKVLLAIVKDTSEDIYLSEYKNQTQN